MEKNIKKAIVITSIFPPTEAVNEFSKLEEYKLVVVADKKTPQNWHCKNVAFLSVEEQEKSTFDLAKNLPYNHYCRKMLGYLKAIDSGATFIIDTDDDNIPKSDWQFPGFDQNFNVVSIPGFINIYQYFTDQKIWPRGLPLNLINTNFSIKENMQYAKCNIGIWQGLADEDPDVDAIYRLTSDKPCFFENNLPVVLDKGTICPFNTQNTMIRKELFALLYLPTYVTFRFTDILRGLIAQPIMWLYNYQLGFTHATVVQKRNPHNYMKDFISELPMYEHCEKVTEIVSGKISDQHTIDNNLYNAYEGLLKNNIICNDEMKTLEAWLKDLQKINHI